MLAVNTLILPLVVMILTATHTEMGLNLPQVHFTKRWYFGRALWRRAISLEGEKARGKF